MKLLLSPLAEEDIRDILQWTLDQWGPDQRDERASLFSARLDELTGFPLLGPARDDVRRGVRHLLVRPHLILYRIEDDAVRELRVVHERRDLKRALDRV